MKNILPFILFVISFLQLSVVHSQNVLFTDNPSLTTPNSFIQIHKNASGTADLLQLSSGTTGFNSANGFKFTINADKSFNLNNQEDAGLYFSTANIRRFNILNDGKIVIGGTGTGSAGTNNLLQVTGGTVTPSSLGTSSFIEFDAPNSSTNRFNFRMAESGTTSYPVISLLKSRGSLDTPSNLTTNDSVGGFAFRGYVNGAWKDLVKISANYTGNGTTQAGSLSFQTANGGNPTTKFVINETGTVSFLNEITYNFVHGSMYLENGAYTPSMPLKNVYYKITPSMTVSTTSGVSLAGDSIIIQSPGYYKVDLVIDMQGPNGNDFRVKMYKNSSGTGINGSGTITTLGAGNRVCLSYFYYFSAVANDRLSFYVTNTSNNSNACTINDMKIYIEKKPQQ